MRSGDVHHHPREHQLLPVGVRHRHHGDPARNRLLVRLRERHGGPPRPDRSDRGRSGRERLGHRFDRRERLRAAAGGADLGGVRPGDRLHRRVGQSRGADRLYGLRHRPAVPGGRLAVDRGPPRCHPHQEDAVSSGRVRRRRGDMDDHRRVDRPRVDLQRRGHRRPRGGLGLRLRHRGRRPCRADDDVGSRRDRRGKLRLVRPHRRGHRLLRSREHRRCPVGMRTRRDLLRYGGKRRHGDDVAQPDRRQSGPLLHLAERHRRLLHRRDGRHDRDHQQRQRLGTEWRALLPDRLPPSRSDPAAPGDDVRRRVLSTPRHRAGHDVRPDLLRPSSGRRLVQRAAAGRRQRVPVDLHQRLRHPVRRPTAVFDAVLVTRPIARRHQEQPGAAQARRDRLLRDHRRLRRRSRLLQRGPGTGHDRRCPPRRVHRRGRGRRDDRRGYDHLDLRSGRGPAVRPNGSAPGPRRLRLLCRPRRHDPEHRHRYHDRLLRLRANRGGHGANDDPL